MYIACPKCDWRPEADDRWVCDCQHTWYTFDTHGVCPACGKTWQDTCCLACGAWSDHEDWYHDENELTVAEYLADPQRAALSLSPDDTPNLPPASRNALEDTLLKMLEAFVTELDQMSTQDQTRAPGKLPSAEALEAIFRGITDPQDAADMKQLKAHSRQPAPTDGYVTLLVPIGAIPVTASLAAAEALKATFIHEVALGGPMDPPPETYRADRQQYRAVPLLTALQQYARPGIFRVIGLIDADIYLPGTNFVFGTQFPGSRAILLGLRRLHGPQPLNEPGGGSQELRRRVAATVVSQVSASLGLGPCRNAGCARAPSNSLADTDRKTAQLCPSCAAQIAAWLKPSYRRRP